MRVSVRLQHVSELSVKLTFRNESDELAFIAPARVGIPEFDGSYFEFDPGPVAYLGRAVRRTGYPSDALRGLDAGAEFTHVVDLGEVYRGIPAHSRTRYIAAHPLSGPSGPPTLLASQWVSL